VGPTAGLDGLENRKKKLFSLTAIKPQVGDLPQRSLVTKLTEYVLLVFSCLFTDTFVPLF